MEMGFSYQTVESIKVASRKLHAHEVVEARYKIQDIVVMTLVAFAIQRRAMPVIRNS